MRRRAACTEPACSRGREGYARRKRASVKFLRARLSGAIVPAVWVFAAVFLVRLIVLVRLTEAPSLLPAGGDMQFYQEWALRIAGGELTDYRAFYGLPLYPYLLALVYKCFGQNNFLPGFLQICADSATAVLVFKIALRVSERPEWPPSADNSGSAKAGRRIFIAACAAAAWALFVPAQAYSVVVMPTAFGTFAFWLIVFQLLKRDMAPGRLGSFAFGLGIGATAMGVATVSSLIPLVLAAVVLKNGGTTGENAWRSKLAASILLLLGLVIGSAPCWTHNFLISRDPVVLSAHSGVNFWIGNNAEATGYPHFPGLRAGQAEMIEDSITTAERSAGKPLKRAEVSAYWSAKAREYIKSQPAAWLRLLARKVVNFWNAFEYDDIAVISRLQGEGVLLPGLRFGLIAALGIPGVYLAFRRSRPARWLAAAILLQMAAVLPVFVTERYRIVVVPGLLIFAAFTVVRLWEQFVRLELRSAAVPLTLIAGTTAFVSLPPKDPNLWALGAYNLGRAALEAGDFGRAEAALQRARAYTPGNPETAFALGNVRLAQGDRTGAKAFYIQTLAVDADHKRALNNLGVMELEDGHADAAEAYFNRALQREPGSATTRYLLARSLLAQNKPKAAKAQIDQATSAQPKQPEFLALREEIDKAISAAEKR